MKRITVRLTFKVWGRRVFGGGENRGKWVTVSEKDR